MKSIKIITGVLVVLVLSACRKDFLDRKPLDQVGASDYFKAPKDLETYVNQFYNNSIFPIANEYGLDFNSDNAVATNFDARLAGTRTLDNANAISFGAVRNVNYFFDNYKRIEGLAAFDDYKQYVGEAHFFRALIYFDLLKGWGDIQWFTSVPGTESPELLQQRDPRNIIADNIIKDLDTAAMYLQAAKTDGAARINKWMALLIQSRVALYEGTWEKYHAGDPFGVASPQPEKYFNKAVEAATKIMESGVYSIYSTGSPNTDYYDLFSKQRSYSGNTEIMFWKNFDNNLGKAEGAFVREVNYRQRDPYEHSQTKELADSYLCTDGNPISGNPLFKGYANIGLEMQNRDSRFFQTFGMPGIPWRITVENIITKYDELYTILNQGVPYYSPCGYVLRKGYDAREQYQVPIFEGTPGIIYRYGEALLNFAEAKAELGAITQDDIDKSIKLLRDRVGMPNLILSAIATDPEWDFPTLSPIINEVRRERRIELAAEGFRFDDIMRWAAADELIVGKRPHGFKAAQLAVNPYPVDADGFLDPYQQKLPAGYGFKIGRDYLNAIPKDQLLLNPSLVQNPGWN
ncbi:MAG: RagB/SusD family nutrient uptake outer membrane protein [Chitinophagaceae bacterium]|nr:RagB/SusD family nutrient uptake outer membrane protein [Chitinophagaceae bacterium]MCW5927745.1 RagB/SusD family nutrient uptake outer membrane protein [Chitinophagaceae bacterium]